MTNAPSDRRLAFRMWWWEWGEIVVGYTLIGLCLAPWLFLLWIGTR